MTLGRTYPSRPIVGVGAIIMSEGKILLEKRKNEPGKGKWSIPGGIVELGESLEQTVMREVREETNLAIADPILVDVVSQVTFDEEGKIKYHFIIIDYIVKLESGKVEASSDAEDLEWVALHNVEGMDLTESFRSFFEKNEKRLRETSS